MLVCPFMLISEYILADGPLRLEQSCILGAEHVGPHMASCEARFSKASADDVGEWIKQGVTGRAE